MPQAVESEGSDEMSTRVDGGERAPAAPADGDHPFRVGRYTILRRIGRGGMGVVYAAYDDRLDRKVALKLVAVSREHGSIGQARLLREAQALARLSHPNVVQVYEVGEHERQVFLAMEFVRGATLREWIRARPRPWPELLAVFTQAGRGLAAAHAAGLVHRDFKPDNALLADDGRVRVLDFGLARALGGEPEDPPSHASDSLRAITTSLDTQDLSHPLTAAGLLLGTPAYMSPEQLRRRPADARSDQYSFCVALWEALYGARPFTGRTLGELKRQVFAGPPRPPRGGVPTHLARALIRGLALAPADRHPSMDALLAALADDPSQRRRRRLLAAAAALTLAAAGIGGYALARRDAAAPTTCDPTPALAGVWDLSLRAAVEQRFTAADLPFAARAFTSTAALLDAHADELTRLLRDVCEARRHGLRDSRTLALQSTCGERRRGELAALVEVLREADPAVIERASQAAAKLPPLTRCTDLAALLAEADQAPEPVEPALAAAVEGQRQQLAAAKARLDAGQQRRARELAAAVVAEAERLGHPPLLAEALVVHGAAELASGDYPAASTALHRGFAVAEAARHDAIAGDAAVRLVHLHGERLHDLPRAQTWAELADAKLQRIGDDGAQRVRLLFYGANALLDAGRLQDAEPRFRAAMALAERRREQDPNFYVIALNALAAFEIEKGAFAEAEPLLRRSLALREAMLGPEHPQVAVVVHNLGLLRYQQRDFTGAAELFRRALAVRERGLGPDHPGTVETLNGLGATLCDAGQRVACLEIYRRVLAIEERRRGHDHLDLFTPLNNLGNALINAGELREAGELLARARALHERHGQTSSPDHALLLYNLGGLHLVAGDPLAAIAALERSLTLREQIYGPTHREVANSLALLAEAELAAGRHTPAEQHAERARDLLVPLPAGILELARVRFILARLRWRDPKRRVEALALARQAVTDLEGQPGDDLVDEARAWLAARDR